MQQKSDQSFKANTKAASDGWQLLIKYVQILSELGDRITTPLPNVLGNFRIQTNITSHFQRIEFNGGILQSKRLNPWDGT